MAEKIVVGGAILACNCGSVMEVLTVTSNTIETVAGKLVATVGDYVADTNIESFGTCTMVQIDGVPQACEPVFADQWQPGSTVHKINGLKVLTAGCTLSCSVGGQVSVISPGQTMAATD